MAAESFVDVVQKTDLADEELEQESKALAAVEKELRAAESQVAVAEARYNLARRQVAKELSKPLEEEKPRSRAQSTSQDPSVDVDAANEMAESQGGHSPKVSKGSKNAGAMTDKQVSSQRWLAKRAAEGRVRDATKRARERLRRSQRDKKFESLEVATLQGDAGHAAQAEARPASVPASTTRKYNSVDIANGAQGIVDRLKTHPDAAAKRTSLVKLLIGGRENVYTFELSDIVDDLKDRGLIEVAVADDLIKLLQETHPPDKSASVPPDQWLEHAQKISSIETLDTPLKEAESTYLKSLEEKRLSATEAELAEAELQLRAALSQVETRYPQVYQESGSPDRKASTEPEVDLDEAARLEELHDSDPVSRGSKNTSALTEKVVSKERWEAARNSENRAREKEVKARDARRTEARDKKMDAGYVVDN
jgi:hypothetical protein